MRPAVSRDSAVARTLGGCRQYALKASGRGVIGDQFEAPGFGGLKLAQDPAEDGTYRCSYLGLRLERVRTTER